MADDTSRKGGRGKGGGGGNNSEKKREDSPAEIAFAMVIERLTAAAGEGAVRILPESMKNEIRTYARGKNLAGAVGVLARVAQLAGGDEEIRGALSGLVTGLGAGIIGVSEDQIQEKTREFLDTSPDLKKLAALAAEGRFHDSVKMPFGDALSYLNEDDKKRVLEMIQKLDLKVEEVDLAATRFSPRELKATASMVEYMKPETAAKYFVARFKKAGSGAENALKEGEKIVKQLREALDKLFAPKPGERPLEERLRNHANQQISAAAAFERAINAVNERHKPKPIPGYVWGGIVAGIVLIGALIGIWDSLGH